MGIFKELTLGTGLDLRAIREVLCAHLGEIGHGAVGWYLPETTGTSLRAWISDVDSLLTRCGLNTAEYMNGLVERMIAHKQQHKPLTPLTEADVRRIVAQMIAERGL